MSFTATNHLKSDPYKNLKGYNHAGKMFTTQQHRLAPKFDFQFHVSFGINQAALKNANIVTRYGNEINMLVKTVALPAFEVQIDGVNQYNRIKQIQYKHKPGDITIKFHDDNMGLINQMWQNYYSYYYADSTSAKQTGAYARNATQSSDYIKTPFGLDNSSNAPFFNYIIIYQMARHEYVSVKLHNPIIKKWDGNGLDYSKSTTHEFTMGVAYEAVSYGLGRVTEGDPEGFAMEHYDNTPSPLQGINPDPTVKNSSFVETLDIQTAAPGILNNAIQTINGYQNTKPSTAPVISSGVANLTTPQTISGLSGISFPQAAGPNGSTTANKIDLG
jgi:hypothetical protein